MPVVLDVGGGDDGGLDSRPRNLDGPTVAEEFLDHAFAVVEGPVDDI